MIAEAVISIQAGENPKKLEQKLRIFLPPEEREKDTEKKEEVAESSASV